MRLAPTHLGGRLSAAAVVAGLAATIGVAGVTSTASAEAGFRICGYVVSARTVNPDTSGKHTRYTTGIVMKNPKDGSCDTRPLSCGTGCDMNRTVEFEIKRAHPDDIPWANLPNIATSLVRDDVTIPGKTVDSWAMGRINMVTCENFSDRILVTYRNPDGTAKDPCPKSAGSDPNYPMHAADTDPPRYTFLSVSQE